jgi:hypothetical protein
MVTGTRARSYDEMVDALAEEGLPTLQNTLAGLTAEDWERSTLLQPPDPDKPLWTVLQLAAHFDVFMGLTMPLVAEVLDEVLARRAVPGRPADLEGDDLAFIRAAAGRGDHPDPRLPVVG